ncbi:hormogonium polysaccharide secretion pseudopilin HpsB [Chroococcidiopsis sp. TS-821]|uniref:hormogonium polysaccharide secretion pseudopilin HpsB n=1 Tax=Chroococcidiopsis sp. TS-821 TaxID=1378066 RepID=UPI000CEDD88C|nr:hormogonium polysaccharide secretion pseudopilin HpsB [Chroococcidiopsis sp. TS-821]PPS44736.1 prepilin-type N-terminal cleavage/methylation domain-containing protein [Chroococcidiopsis sp. TS-821]
MISRSQGFTIVDALVAIVVVGILMSAIAPVMVLSVGNRVQARRVELATQAAKTYLDGIRNGTIPPPNHTVVLNEVDTSATRQFNAQRVTFANAAVPPASGLTNCTPTTPDYPYCQNSANLSLYCIDFDAEAGCSSNSVRDLVVQAFRSVTPTSTDATKGYLLGVRVYRADAFSDSLPLVKSDADTRRTQATFTSGLGDRKAPLLEITTEISTTETRLQDLCDRLGGCQL